MQTYNLSLSDFLAAFSYYAVKTLKSNKDIIYSVEDLINAFEDFLRKVLFIENTDKQKISKEKLDIIFSKEVFYAMYELNELMKYFPNINTYIKDLLIQKEKENERFNKTSWKRKKQNKQNKKKI